MCLTPRIGSLDSYDRIFMGILGFGGTLVRKVPRFGSAVFDVGGKSTWHFCIWCFRCKMQVQDGIFLVPIH